MRVATILRGFPGLGRVVAGVEVTSVLRRLHNAQTRIYSYLNGWEYLKYFHEHDCYRVDDQNISCIGIIPVSPGGEALLGEVCHWRPDVIVCDGEPLLVRSFRLTCPSATIIVLLNPFDVYNPINPFSSQLFFNDCYSNADIAIVHGLTSVKDTFGFSHFHSIPTIVRSEILSLRKNGEDRDHVVCILGGGSNTTDPQFAESSLKAALKCADVVLSTRSEPLHIFCGSNDISRHLQKSIDDERLRIYGQIASAKELYARTKIAVARGGRNTLSEILYLGLPALAFATSAFYRGNEQSENINAVESLSGGRILPFTSSSSTEEIVLALAAAEDSSKTSTTWQPGNCFLNEILG
ncbi:MAG TPA: glycosyltransferase [bacterium]|nr:glycosyltransferase [bacterium]